MRDRDLVIREGLFIAEGEQLVRRLIGSTFAIRSILCLEKRAAEIGALAEPGTPIYVADDAIMHDILGFKFHTGCLALGEIGLMKTLDDVLPRDKPALKLMLSPNIANVENIGGMIRIAAGFGCDAVVLGPECHNPFYRQAVRVSMGTVFYVPIVRSTDWLGDLRRLRTEWDVELIASVLDESAGGLRDVAVSPRVGLLMGSESQGLDAATIATCSRRVTIPMHLGTDSLNVVVAAGIFAHHFFG